MKAVALPCAAVVAVGDAGGFVELGDPRLGADRGLGEEWVLVVETVENFIFRNACGRVDRDEVIYGFGYALEAVHPVVCGMLPRGINAVIP